MSHNDVKRPTPFDSFNARNISPKQVAETFIPPEQYYELSRRSHNLLVGPRGSGKTTLMKMLHPSALDNWIHSKAQSVRDSIDYTGIFVPSDVMWGAQVGSLGGNYLSDKAKNLLARSAFSTNVLDGFIESIMYRISKDNKGFRKVVLNSDNERSFATLFSETARLNIPFNSIAAIKFSLADRRNKIYEIASKAEFVSDKKRNDFISDHDFLHIDYLATLINGIEVFNHITKQPDARWALLFDELEIAPENILDQLLSSLRSTNDKLIFKLSLSPYHKEVDKFHNALSAMPNQDYTNIPLWFSKKVDSFAFSQQLLKSLLKTKLDCEVDIDKVFSNSDFKFDDDIFSDEEGNFEELTEFEEQPEVPTYQTGGRGQKRLRSLYQADPSFKSYIDNLKIDLNKIPELDNQIRAQHIRKIAPVVFSRLEFRKVLKEIPQSRSRKNPITYTGAEAILAIAEGNPRWLIGLANSMLAHINESKKIPKSLQAKEIRKAANRFRALIKVIPCNSTILKKKRGVLSLLDLVGNEFYSKIVIDDFKAEPYGSFVVDSHVEPEILEALGKALNAGAIIYVPDNSDILLGSIKGKRFRLSYLLASHYRLPLTLLRETSLLKILESAISNNSDETIQLDIWKDNED